MPHAIQLFNNDWRYIEASQLSGYSNSWTPLEQRLLGTSWGEENSDGIFWSKAGKSTGPARSDFNDSAWTAVTLPHDWSVAQPRSPEAPERNGYYPVGLLWYRKRFSCPADWIDRRIRLRFGGVYRASTLFINGHLAGHHESGYLDFEVDISALLLPGKENVIALRVDGRKKEGWYYEGTGIYRDVELVIGDDLYLERDSLTVCSELAEDHHKATLSISGKIINDRTEPIDGAIHLTLNDPEGHSMPTEALTLSIPPLGEQTFTTSLSLSAPQLWSPDQPALYQLTCRIESNQGLHDKETVSFGIRSVVFDPQQGFFLNGEHLFLKGVCCHQDHAGIGTAVPDALIEYRLGLLKTMGANAYRVSHHPASRALLAACDRLGMLVIDEARIVGVSKEALAQVTAMVRAHRNHPSVILWSLGNEEMEIQFTNQGKQILAAMARAVRREDPTRPTTVAANGSWTSPRGVVEAIDVMGANYLNLDDVDDFPRNHPEKPFLISEACSHVFTRGEYADDVTRNVVSAYDIHERPTGHPQELIWPIWGRTAEAMWQTVVTRPYIAGTFVWTGFDYRGEQTPYGHWPVSGSNFGILDQCGFPKDIYYFYRAWWQEAPVLHILPHWTWPGREGDPVDVWVYSNAEAVELYLNGRSLGRRMMPTNSHLQWTIPYAPGSLEAVAYRDTQEILRCRRCTAGTPNQIDAESVLSQISGPDSGFTVVNITLRDEEGTEVPDDDRLISCRVEGAGRILGVGNGNPSLTENDSGNRITTFHGRAQVLLIASPDSVLHLEGEGLPPQRLTFPAGPTESR